MRLLAVLLLAVAVSALAASERSPDERNVRTKRSSESGSGERRRPWKHWLPVVHEHNDHLYVYNHVNLHDNDYHTEYDDEHEYNNDNDALDNDYNYDNAIHDNYDHPIDDNVNYYHHQQSDYH